MKNFFAITFIVILASGLYLFTLRGVPGNPEPGTIKATLEQPPKPFELSPERGRFAHVLSLAETGHYALSQELGEFVYPDVGWRDGKFYSYFAPGISYMALPFYLLGRHYNLSQVFTFGFISLVSILALIFLYLIARNILKMPVWASLLAVIIFAFGSTAWSYAVTLYQHHVTVFFILSSFYAVWKYKHSKSWSFVWGAWVWTSYALALTIDYPNALLLLPVMIYFFVVSIRAEQTETRFRVALRAPFVLSAIFFVIITGLHLYHNQTEFGSWKRVSGSLVGYKEIKAKNWETLPVSEIQKNITTAQKSKDNVAKFFTETQIPNSPGTLLFSKDRGLFFFGPIFLLALLGMYVLTKKINLEIGILFGLVSVNLFLYGSWGDPWGGWSYGTRYLIPSMSVLALFVAYWVSRPRFSLLRKLVAFILFAYSSAVALIGVLTTNAVPPRVEADYLHTGYNYLLNWKFFIDSNSGSFLYNTYFKYGATLPQYAAGLYLVLLLVFVVVVFVLPWLFKDDTKQLVPEQEAHV